MIGHKIMIKKIDQKRGKIELHILYSAKYKIHQAGFSNYYKNCNDLV